MMNINEKDKVAFFDFCGTLINFQTADEFVCYTIKKYSTKKIQLKYFVYKILMKVGVVNFLQRHFKNCSNLSKRLLLFTIRGLNRSTLEQVAAKYVDDRLLPNLVKSVVDCLYQHQIDGFRIVIVSAGYDIYIKKIAKLWNINECDIICNNFLFAEDGRFCGKYDKDLIGITKVVEIEKRFNKNEIYSVSYSDSYSDLPLLQWCNEGNAVIKAWWKDYNLKEVLY